MNAAEALTHIDLVVTLTRDEKFIDLGTGSKDAKYDDIDLGGLLFSTPSSEVRDLFSTWSNGKDYRYILQQKSAGSEMAITSLQFIRSPTELRDIKAGYGRTGNINENRKGDWLYLEWKLQQPISLG
ncbi:hypothetical protein H0H92_009361 [Tricholoma furcatifolium]|nr:hypothetical protein H0H92_009361 [Tricholoma furcatifolium]